MNSDSLYAKLKSKTTELHPEAHSIPYMKNLFKNNLPLESYIGHLRCFSIIYAVLERQIETTNNAVLQKFTELYIPKSSLIDDDLRYLSASDTFDILPAIRNALSIADKIILFSASDPLRLISYIYIMEGTLNGSSFMLEHLNKIFNLPDGKGLKYFSALTQAQTNFWNDFTEKLNTHLFSESQKSLLIKTAIETFRDLTRMYEKLFPVHPETLGRHISALNPEAGNHPMPQDPDEITAISIAARKCLADFPYIKACFGTRGEKYTLSDAAWITSLIQEPEQTGKQQFLWLCDFLTKKGVPCVCQTEQLNYLYTELSKVHPKKEAHYKKLLTLQTLLYDGYSEKKIQKLYNSANQSLLNKIQNRTEELPNLSRIQKNLGKLIAASIYDTLRISSQKNELMAILKTKNGLNQQEVKLLDELYAGIYKDTENILK